MKTALPAKTQDSPVTRAGHKPQAQPSAPDKDTGTRRSFLLRIWAGLGLAAAAELTWVALSFLKPTAPGAAPGDYGGSIDCGPAEGFAKGSVTAFPRGHFYLCRLEDGGFLALSRQCTHLGCTLPWDAETKSFRCPCHGSAFDITGSVVNPPALRPLDLYPVVIENTRVRVDTGRLTQRRRFTPEQAVHANTTGGSG